MTNPLVARAQDSTTWHTGINLLDDASGVAEVGVAAALAAPRTRKAGAAAAVALFLAVWPGNINMCRLWWDKPWPMRAIAIARLPLQIPMITQALAIRRHAPRRG